MKVEERAAYLLVDVLLNWRAYACIRCHERMAEHKSLLCAGCTAVLFSKGAALLEEQEGP